MVGRRKNNPLGLEPRVHPKHGAFYYVHRDNRWEHLGTDVYAANQKARFYNGVQGDYGTVAYWLDEWVIDCEKRVKVGTLAQRTYEDYKEDVEPLKLYFKSPMRPIDIEPQHVQDYLDIGEEYDRPVRANRERAALSSCISWLLRTGKVEGLVVNPCLLAQGIKLNREAKRDRYVTDDEYRDTYRQAPTQIKAMMELCYRTLQSPESDVLDWTVANVTVKDGGRILTFKQGKTGKQIDIALSPDLDTLIRKLVGDPPQIGRPLVCTRLGERYTYDGISAMLKRAISKANVERVKLGLPKIESFGYSDLRGKGATDMWQANVPLEDIQLLCGHEDRLTTETYVKQRWRPTVMPNMVKIGG